jgi:catechol 2,3-dioxygenase-like lactoylglutathione lyase family enzyme
MITLRHVGLIVDDIEKSLDLYEHTLGFKPKVDQVESGVFYEHLTGIDSGVARTCKCYAMDGTCIELIQYTSHNSEKRTKELLSSGFNHIALNIPDLELLENKLKKMGIKFINPPMINDNATAKVAFCYDYEGNLLELVQVYE